MREIANEQNTPAALHRKRMYAPPNLKFYGLVKDLTAGGSRMGVENDPFGCENSSVGPIGPCKP